MNYLNEIFISEEDKLMFGELFSNEHLRQKMLENKEVFQDKFKEMISKYNKAIKKLTNLNRKCEDVRIVATLNKFKEEKLFMINTFAFLFKNKV